MDIRPQNRRAAFAFTTITILAVVSCPLMWIASGVICARDCRRNGIRLLATPAFSHVAMGFAPVSEVGGGECEMNEALRDWMMDLGYFREVYGVEEGLSWFCFAIGVGLAR